MARQRRIRHKLMLGFGLVAGTMALSDASQLKGLVSYSDAIRSIELKQQEQARIGEYIDAVGALRVVDNKPNTLNEADRLTEKIDFALKKLSAYEAQLQDTLARHRDPENGISEKGHIEAIRLQTETLKKVIKADVETFHANASATGGPLCQKKPVADAIEDVMRSSAHLQEVIFEHIQNRIDETHRYYRYGLTFGLASIIAGSLIMAGLLRFFYGWVFYPIRDLQEGAGRIARGDFDHRIAVHSGDEMEELAVAFNDMTGRLQEMYSDLARQVNERSRQLVRSEQLASVGFLAAGVAHEINNPMASIVFCSEALESRIAPLMTRGSADNAVIAKYLKMIQQEAFRCKAITQRLLEFSRTGERKCESTHLGELVQSVIDVVMHLENSRGKQILFEPAGPMYAWVNGPEIKSVVLNLVVNALDSMEESGVLAIKLSLHTGMAQMTFSDTGCGMTPEVLQNIFEPFYTRSRTGKGTGLGLSISHRIVTEHGGQIEVVSAGPNQGSVFTVRLPLKPAEAVKEDLLGHAAA